MYEYNPALLERHVRRLHRNARISLITIPFLVAVLGMAAGAGYAYWSKLYIIRDMLVYAGVGGVIGLLVGILFGLSASARKREQAQIPLGILRIEQNTRPAPMDTSDFIPLDTSDAIYAGPAAAKPMQAEFQTE
jgi:L-cystine uptake protein TcyP (sodium:dicarboxylate symporter family)